MERAGDAPAARLPELLEAFGCADVVAPIDAYAFGSKASEVICGHRVATVTPTAAKYRLRALQCVETAAQSRDPYARDVLTELAEEFMQAARQAEKLVRRAA
jgi:hypothetical protein